MTHIRISLPRVFRAAGTLTVLAVGLMMVAVVGCRKDMAEPTAGTKTQKIGAQARTITDSEAAQIVADAEDFEAYAKERRIVGNPVLGGLSDTMNGERANDLLENTYNYYYARVAERMLQYQTDSVVFTVPVTAEGKVEIEDAADAFNKGLREMKAAFVAVQDSPDVQLSVVDVSWATAGEDIAFTIAYTIGWDEQAEITIEEFPTSECWHWQSNQGDCQGQMIGVWGAPQALRQMITSNMGYVPSSNVALPINIQTEGNTSPSTVLDFTTSLSNTWASGTFSVVDNLAFYATTSQPSTVGGDVFIPALGLNYYRAQTKAAIQAAIATLNKSFLFLQITTSNSSAPSGYSYGHLITVQFCNYAFIIFPNPISITSSSI